ncbi:MAG: FAD-dependent thymidylate synthase [bacterium]|nr:FAD-dependent thymidylate synthase [bacterium]
MPPNNLGGIYNKGVFIVIEGTDWSGKGTQYKLLVEKLEAKGYEVEKVDFPQYSTPSAYFVERYLNGDYGSSDDVGPYTGSLFYALDRYAARNKIQSALDAGKIVIANRFTGSNMAHQGTKFVNPEERRGFFVWLDNLEFQMLGIPRPDKSFVLKVPAEIAQKLVDQKSKRDYTDKKRDILEADLDHLKTAEQVYEDLCSLFPKDFEKIDCVRDGELLSIDAVHKLIWEKIYPYLPIKKESSMHEVEKGPYIVKNPEGHWERTPKGQEFAEQAFTDLEGDVYFITEHLNPVTAAAAMARLSRRGDDMRVTVLDEFAEASAAKDEKLLERVITAYGDDSVQQLVGSHFVVEGASNLLTKQLEWGRLAAYLEQSTRYIYFDQPDEKGKFKYYTPENFSEEMQLVYDARMDEIFTHYSSMVRSLTEYVKSKKIVEKPDDNDKGGMIAWNSACRAQACDAIRPVLPTATKSTVGIFASGQALEMLIMRLRGERSEEARRVGDQLLREGRKQLPTFLQRADLPERGGATTMYMAETRENTRALAQELLPSQHSMDTEPVTLTNYTPKNEMDIVPDILYPFTDMSLAEIEEAIKDMSYEDKSRVMETYMGERFNRRHKPGRALEIPRYTWDIMCDYGIFRDLQRHRMVDNLQWQDLTPRFGYEVPDLVEEAGLSDEFTQCFDISMKLYSEMQQAGYAYEAQYATLLGHRMRWTISYSAREAFHLHELRTAPQGHPGYRKLVGQMHEKLCEVHPIIGSAMKFVNKDEDPELTRLAAEKTTQAKLERLTD